MRMTRLFASVLAATATVAATSAYAQDCKPKHEFTTAEKGFLTAGAVTFNPYSYIDSSGNVQGVDADILIEIATMECLQLKTLPTDAAAGIQTVVSGRADVSTGAWYRTKDRTRVVNLSAPLYLDQMAVYSKEGVTRADQLDGKTVGSVQGNLWVADLQKVFGENLKLYPTSVAMHQDLVAGRLDAAFDGYSTGVTAIKAGTLSGIKVKVIEADKRIGASKEAGQGTFPMNKKNEAFTAAIDDDIAELHKNGKIAEILVKHGLDASAAETGAPRLIQ
ncbi:substrate-binding periplasmic protein [Mesorhizobium sp. CO1-1-8]|uniref:substrate-binding periplasmic protein n=1 Tax=Mesorhizobium sp. CO1-1-8 TaxID=2876631 RepID=UPI001CD14E0D|nr:transporter substrate-binding domain-containing protein [Mesorhizobium sp. CO1-1-8]MBZ9775028.1 transporter substrate-binding domain-containing protein [Mesorhizobium sp. CO1-1-8]